MPTSAIYAGSAATIEGERIYLISLQLPASEMDAIVVAFDPQSPTSPPAADCRFIAKPVVEAIRAAQEQP